MLKNQVQKSIGAGILPHILFLSCNAGLVVWMKLDTRLPLWAAILIVSPQTALVVYSLLTMNKEADEPIARNLSTIEGSEERGGSCVVAEGLTKVGELIDIPRAKNEAAPQLKRMQSQMMLTVAGRTGVLAALKIIATKNVKQVGDAQVGDGVRLAM